MVPDDHPLKPILERIPIEYGRYVEILPGWFDIVLELDREIAKLYPDYEVQQVKQKLGGLRYYCEHDGDELVYRLIAAAEKKASQTCEHCGKPGHMRGRGWLMTTCDEHAPKGEP